MVKSKKIEEFDDILGENEPKKNEISDILSDDEDKIESDFSREKDKNESKIEILEDNFEEKQVKIEIIEDDIQVNTQFNDTRWLTIDDSARNGMPYWVADKPEGDGILAFWKKTRKYIPTMKHWSEYGKFVDHITGTDLTFEPKYFRHRF